MAGRNSEIPDPTLMAEIRQMIRRPKTWVASGEMSWVNAGGRPPGFTFRERLQTPDGAQPANLYVECYFKPATVHGFPDKLSLGLYFHGFRILAIDENGPGGHLNIVGLGRPHYGERVGFPHVHSVSDDSIYGLCRAN